MRDKLTIAVCVTSLGAEESEILQIPEAFKNLSQYFDVEFVNDIRVENIFGSQSVSKRIESLNLAAKNADIVLAYNGGFNAIELLFESEKIEMSKDKIFVGYSDNTILANALPAMGVCRAWQGPMLANWIRTPQYGALWAECISALYEKDYPMLTRLYNRCGLTVFRSGAMKGKIWGGNNYSFDLLQGTEFCPKFNKPFILLLEGEDCIVAKNRVWQDFIRNLDSIMLLPGARENIRGLLIGKFSDLYTLNENEVSQSILSRGYLKDLPIAYNFPRGYGKPGLYLPIGEEMTIKLKRNNTLSFE